MPIFLVLYHDNGLPKSEVEKLDRISELSEFDREIGSCLVDGGSPTLTGTKITRHGVKPLPSEPVTAYSLLVAQGLDEAVELSRGAPSLNKGGSAEVYEIAA